MTISELDLELKALGIPESDYYLHGLYGSTDDRDKVALRIMKGKYTLVYEVYYIERGELHVNAKFYTEDEACQYVLKRFRWQQDYKANTDDKK